MTSNAVANVQGSGHVLPSGRRRPMCSKCGTPMLGHKNGRKMEEGILICPPGDDVKEEDIKPVIASDVPLDLKTSYPGHLQARTYHSAPPSPDRAVAASSRGRRSSALELKDHRGFLRTRLTLPQDYVLDFQKRPWEAGSPAQRTIAENDKLISVLDDVARHGGVYIMPYNLESVQITSVRDLAAKMGLFTRLEAVPSAYVEDGKSMFVIVGDRKEQVFAKDVVDRHLRLWDKNEMPGSISKHRMLEEKQVARPRHARPALVVDRFFNVLLFLFIVFLFGAVFAFYLLASA
ncbi:hypothetical protein EV715DRAFT_247599 [Schizophyllum commune]